MPQKVKKNHVQQDTKQASRSYSGNSTVSLKGFAITETFRILRGSTR